jgi:hypothetical protein
MVWAVERARSKSPVISGFHSPLEQSVLEVLLTAGAPCVMIIARRLEKAHFPPAWLLAVQNGAAAIVSIGDDRTPDCRIGCPAQRLGRRTCRPDCRCTCRSRRDAATAGGTVGTWWTTYRLSLVAALIAQATFTSSCPAGALEAISVSEQKRR